MFHVYILSNPGRTTLYVNATSDLSRTIARHKKGLYSKFTRKYKLVHMIYLETFRDKAAAEARHRQLKNWHRDWKWNLVLAANPKLRELVHIDAETSSASPTKKAPKKERLCADNRSTSVILFNKIKFYSEVISLLNASKYGDI